MREVERSGKSLVAWAHEHDVDARSLNMWKVNLERRRANRPKPQPARSRRFVEWIPAEGPARATASYLVRCGRFEVEVSSDFDEATLSRLLSVVAAC